MNGDEYMKTKIKYSLALVVSIICIALLLFVSYLQIQDHVYKGLVWYGLSIIILLSGSVIYVKKLIQKTTNDDQNDDSDTQMVLIQQKADAKTMNIIGNITFWCGMILMTYASSQLHESPQFSYILFGIAFTLVIIWVISFTIEIFYIFKYLKQENKAKE